MTTFATDAERFDRLFRLKYGAPEQLGPVPRAWLRHGYREPDLEYEAAVDQLVGPSTSWLDVGCGRFVLPTNTDLARELAGRCRRLVGLDPSETIAENSLVHEKFRGYVENYQGTETFDLVTLRMVAEHVEEPARLVAGLERLTHPGSIVVVYTVDARSPASLAARAVPHGLHHGIKRRLWGTEECDTFPVAYRMNTPRRLASLFETHGFRTTEVRSLADCRLFYRWPVVRNLELGFWILCRSIGLRYPECNLLGRFERMGGLEAASKSLPAEQGTRRGPRA